MQFETETEIKLVDVCTTETDSQDVGANDLPYRFTVTKQPLKLHESESAVSSQLGAWLNRAKIVQLHSRVKLKPSVIRKVVFGTNHANQLTRGLLNY